MRKILFLAAVLFSLMPVASYGFSEKGQDCAKCHTLSKDDASKLLSELIPNVKVLDVLTSPIKGMWEVDVETQGRKGLVYVDFSKKHLVSGAVISIKDKKNLSQDRMSDLNRVDVSKIPLEDALVMGEKDAKHKIIVFDDPD